MLTVDEKLAFRKREACDLIGVGITKLDSLIAAGVIRAVKSAKTVLILREDLKHYIESLPPIVVKDYSNYKEDKVVRAERRAAERAGEPA
jgi:excisionase family DNA binding protein